MSVPTNPGKAVQVLEARLNRAKKKFNEETEGHLLPKFEYIENQLKEMGFLSKINSWEEKEVKQLSVLEQFLDDIFRFNYSTSKSHLHENLELFQKDVSKLKDLISRFDNGLIPKSSSPGTPSDDGDSGTTLSKEWTNLGAELKIVETSAMTTLCNAFHCLRSPELKMCSLCLSVFPENAVIKKRTVIYWWMGEGLVVKTGNATAEEVGERVFEELLQEGFIRHIKNNNKSFVVCPWIRRMLVLLAQESGFLKFTPNGTPCDGERRSFMWQGIPQGGREEDVLTVFNINEQYIGDRSEWLRRLQKVEVLQMGRWQESAAHHIEVEDYKKLFFNSGLGSQKHLRYLSLRGISRIESLPPAIKKLVSLRILDLRACHNLEKLPAGIAELINLTHLDVSECYLLESMPKGLDRLAKLQVMKGFVVGPRNGCKLADMARLKDLRKLSLRVRENDEQLRSLGDFKALQILTISWGLILSESESVTVVAELPKNLTKLDLRCVPFEVVPDWMKPKKVPKLKKLYITGGKLKSINSSAYPDVTVLRPWHLAPNEAQAHQPQ